MAHIHRRSPQDSSDRNCPTGKQYWTCTTTPTQFHGCCIGNPCYNNGICPDKDGPNGEPLTTTIARSKTTSTSTSRSSTTTATATPTGSNTNAPEPPPAANSASTSAPAAPAGSPNQLGAIIGGCMGGLALLLALGALFYIIRLRRRVKHGANAPTSSSAATAMDPSKPPVGTPPAPWQSPAPKYSPPLASPGFADKSFLHEQQQQQQHSYAELPAPYAGPAELGGDSAATSSSPFQGSGVSARGSGGGDGGGVGGHQWSK